MTAHTLLIGLTGGIGSGKSTVAAIFAEAGCVVIDADQLAREVVEPGTPALAQLVEAFGDDILDEKGALRRDVLASKAFATPETTETLSSIVHPAVRAESRRRMAAAQADPDVKAVVYDVPLLVESGRKGEFEHIVVVHCPKEIRLERLVSLRGMDREDALRRIEKQASDEERLAIADTVIDNSGSLADTKAQVDKAIAKLLGGAEPR